MDGGCVRRTVARLVLVVPLLAGALAFGGVRPAEAASYTCVGDVSDQTVKGNVIVPQDAECTLTGVVVTGSVTVRAGGDFNTEGTEIRGGISASGSYDVQLYNSVVRGPLSVSRSTYVDIFNTRFFGNVSISGTTPAPDGSGYVYVAENTFRTSVVLSDNDFDSEAFSGNSIGINLVCDDNTEAFIYGNEVGGQVIGDCPDAESTGGDS